MSIAKILDLFAGGAVQERPRQDRHDPLRLATAAILLDIAHADGAFSPVEGGSLVAFLSERFHLSDEDVRELIGAADEIRKTMVDHFAFTNTIRKNTPLGDRIEIVKTMWRMVYSDGVLTDYESYLVRKLADLLGLEHHVMIEAKSAVLREMGR
ncbi:MAG: TerB family tellurite resistance protein [Acidobacteriota bacterium]